MQTMLVWRELLKGALAVVAMSKEYELVSEQYTWFSRLLCSAPWFFTIWTWVLPSFKAFFLKAFPAIDSYLTQSSLPLKLLYNLNTFSGPLIHMPAFKYIFLCWKIYKILELLQIENPKIKSRNVSYDSLSPTENRAVKCIDRWLLQAKHILNVQ